MQFCMELISMDSSCSQLISLRSNFLPGASLMTTNYLIQAINLLVGGHGGGSKIIFRGK